MKGKKAERKYNTNYNKSMEARGGEAKKKTPKKTVKKVIISAQGFAVAQTTNKAEPVEQREQLKEA